jgi:hypothetical protein
MAGSYDPTGISGGSINSLYDSYGLGKYWSVVSNPSGLTQSVTLIGDSAWFTYDGPVINASATKIWNERGDVFNITSTGVSKEASGTMAVLSDDPTGFPVNNYNRTGQVGVSGGRWGNWFSTNGGALTAATVDTGKYEGVDSDGMTWTEDGSPETANGVAVSQGPEASSGVRAYITAGSSYAAKFGFWSKVAGLDVFNEGNVDITTDTSGRLSFSSYPDAETFVFPFPYATAANPDKMFFIELRDYYVYPADATLHTPYGQYEAPSGLFSFHGWLSLHNGEHVLQAWIIRTNPTTYQRYIYLDGVEYGATIASAVGCTIDEIRAIYFDIKSSDFNRLQ